MDFHLVPGRGNHHDPADRVAGAVALGAAAGSVGVAGFSGFVAAVLDGLEPGKHDRVSCHAGFHRRRADPAGVHPDPDQTPRAPPRQRHGDVRHDRDVRPVHRPDTGRLAHGKLGLGVHLLHQHSAGADHDRRADVRAGEEGSALGTAEKHRLHRHPHPRCRPRLSAGISRRRPPQGLARIEPDRDPGQHRPHQPDHLCDRADFQAQPADQPRHPAQSQLRPFEYFQPRHGRRAIRFDLSAAAVSGADPELQRPADRRSDHVDGRAAAVSDSTGAEADEVRVAEMAVHAGLRTVRAGEFFVGGAQPGLCRAAVQSDPDHPRPRPAADHGDHFPDRHGVHPAAGRGVGVEPVQYPA